MDDKTDIKKAINTVLIMLGVDTAKSILETREHYIEPVEITEEAIKEVLNASLIDLDESVKEQIKSTFLNNNAYDYINIAYAWRAQRNMGANIMYPELKDEQFSPQLIDQIKSELPEDHTEKDFLSAKYLYGNVVIDQIQNAIFQLNHYKSSTILISAMPMDKIPLPNISPIHNRILNRMPFMPLFPLIKIRDFYKENGEKDYLDFDFILSSNSDAGDSNTRTIAFVFCSIISNATGFTRFVPSFNGEEIFVNIPSRFKLEDKPFCYLTTEDFRFIGE